MVLHTLISELSFLLFRNLWRKKRERHISSILSSCDAKHRIFVVWIPFDFWPPDFGGAIRVINLYSELTQLFTLHLVGVTSPWKRFACKQVDTNLFSWSIPFTLSYVFSLKKQQRAARGKLHDILLTTKFSSIPLLEILCSEFSQTARVMVCSHPYLFPLIRKYALPSTTLIYDAHNVDALLKTSYFEDPEGNPAAKAFLALVRQTEQQACRESEVILAASGEDAQILKDIYGPFSGKVIVVPNSIDTANIPFHAREKDRDIDRFIIFIGSDHAPNREAVIFLINRVSQKFPELTFIIAGSVNQSFTGQMLPPNIRFTGVINHTEKEELYRRSALAVNPMFSGSGTNLKVPEYMAAGVPVLSTSFGMRGLGPLIPGVYLSEAETFGEAITNILTTPQETILEKTRLARLLAENHSDKKKVILPLIHFLAEINADNH